MGAVHFTENKMTLPTPAVHPTNDGTVVQEVLDLPHDVSLSVRRCGPADGPRLLFLHGFPEAAFVWDALLLHFGAMGYHAVAPNLRGFERSSAPSDPAQYRVKALLQDLHALLGHLGVNEAQPLECLVAHDWGGAVAWALANQTPRLMRRLCIANSPHPGTFLKALQTDPEQIAASAYMNFLVRPDAETLLAENDFARLWPFFNAQHGQGAPASGPPAWLTEAVKNQYREVWHAGLTGGCNYYRASPLRPATAQDPGAKAISLPPEMLHISVPTLVVWGLLDTALRPVLLENLGSFIPQLTLETWPDASHWLVHEHPERLIQRLTAFLNS